MELFTEILLLVYLVLGYWSCGKTVYANKIRIGTWSNLVIQRFLLGAILGWVLIPIAIIRCVFRI